LVLKEFLVALGLKDNMSENLNKSLKSADGKVSKFASGFAKQFALAGVAVAAMTTAAALGVGKFVVGLEKADSELETFARNMGVTKEEAYKTKSALDVMGKSLEEVKLNPTLLKQFEELKANAASLEIPDMSEGLKSVRDIGTAVLALKQTATNALQWVGFNFLKYVQKPMEDAKKLLNGYNETIKKNIPDWSDKVGKALSWVVQLGTTVIRGAAEIFKAIGRVFDMIPDKIKLVMGAFALLGAFIKAGPIGKMIMVISAVLLLLDDFFTYLDGGESLLGPVWKVLIDWFDKMKEYIPTVKKALSDIYDVILKNKELLIAVVGVLGLFKLGSHIQKILKLKDSLGIFGKALSFLTSPLGLVIVAVGALVAGLAIFQKNGGDVGALVEKITSGFSDLVGELVNGVNTVLPKIVGIVSEILPKVIDAIVEFLPVILDTGVTLLLTLVDGIVSVLPTLLTAVIDLVDTILTTIVEALPKLIDAGIDILLKLVDGILAALPELLKAVTGLISQIVKALTKLLPKIIDAGIEILLALVDGIVKELPQIIDTAMELILTLLDAIIDMLPDIIEMGVTLLVSLIEGIVNAIPKLIQAVVALIPKIVQAVTDNLPKIIDAGITLLLSLIQGIVDSIPQLVQAVVDLIPKVVQALVDNLPQIIKAGIQLIISLVGGLIQAIPQLIAALPQIVAAILEGIGTAIVGIVEIGGQLLSSLWDGISGAGAWLIEKVTGFFTGVVDKIKGALGAVWDFFTGGKKDVDVNVNQTTTTDGHAEGGVFNKEHTARFAEGDKPEAVIPLTKPQRAAEVMREAADFMGGSTTEPSTAQTRQTAATTDKPREKPGSKVSNVLFSAIEKLNAAVLKLAVTFEKWAAVLTSGGRETDTDEPITDVKPNPVRELVTKIISKETTRERTSKETETVREIPTAQTRQTAATTDKAGKKLLEVVEKLNGFAADVSAFFSKMSTFLDNANRIMEQMGQTTQSSVAYSAVSNSNVNYNTTQIDNKQNYTINDTSGNPRVTADMVSRTQALHNRNMKGVFA
jgi:phage-related protein